MSRKDNEELNRLFSSESEVKQVRSHLRKAMQGSPLATDSDKPDSASAANLTGLVQWTTADKKRFVPASTTADLLTTGVYEIQHSSTIGIYFEKIPVKTEGLIRFPQTNSDRVVREIQTFWEKEDRFAEYGLTYKRGIILYGPPGSGKSCTIQLIIQDVVQRGGIVIKFTTPDLFMEGMRIFREIQPDTPAVVLMEDVDSILEVYNESQVLNILDGVDQVEKLVFLATTNYPERLGARIMNRPSRFDKRFKIDHPDPESRRLYFEHIIGKDRFSELGIDINKWVEDTDKFSIAHLKELFVAVVILGDDYGEAVETLSYMREIVSSAEDEKGIGLHNIMGFSKGKGTKQGYKSN